MLHLATTHSLLIYLHPFLQKSTKFSTVVLVKELFTLIFILDFENATSWDPHMHWIECYDFRDVPSSSFVCYVIMYDHPWKMQAEGNVLMF